MRKMIAMATTKDGGKWRNSSHQQQQWQRQEVPAIIMVVVARCISYGLMGNDMTRKWEQMWLL
jgi:hypothetical protein